MVYHPRLIDLVFPNSSILRRLAEEHSLITTVDGSSLNSMQKNLIKEWLQKPVYAGHPVFHGATKLFDRHFPVWMKDDTEFWSETEVDRWRDESDSSSTNEQHYRSAVEEHPIADRKKKSKRKLFRLKDRLKRKTNYKRLEDVDEGPASNSAEQVEMNMYGQHSSFGADGLDQICL